MAHTILASLSYFQETFSKRQSVHPPLLGVHFKSASPLRTTLPISMTILKSLYSRKAQPSCSSINLSPPRVRAKCVFSSFPKIPEVDLTEAERLLALAKAQTIAVGGMYAQKSCYWEKINETYSLVVQQSEEGVNLVKKEMSASVKDQIGLSEIRKSFLPQIYRTEETSAPRKKRFIGAVAAIGAGAGLILGDPIKDAACTALSIS